MLRSILFFMAITAPISSQAAELLMIEEPHCIYCERFNREISEAYPKTSEGQRAPLVRLQIDEKWPSTYSSVKKTSTTPTFILVDNGVEVDRLIGYPGDEHFWFLLGKMLRKLQQRKMSKEFA